MEIASNFAKSIVALRNEKGSYNDARHRCR